ncbi:MAG TPA: hypothetical protein VIK61_05495 [Acidimicrobiia bacterium]
MSRIQIKPLTIGLVLLAALFVIAGFVYFTTAAKSLPAFFPGHDAHLASKHTKHGIAMIGLAVLSLIGAWFTTAPSEPAG